MLALALLSLALSAHADTLTFGPSTFTAPGAFATSIFSKYYNSPTATSAQVQPVISDPVSHVIYPLALTDPDTIPGNDTTDVHPLPAPVSASALLARAIAQITSLAANPVFGNNTCAQCQAGLEVAQFLALTAPEQVPTLLVAICNQFDFSSSCADDFGPLSLGGVITQVLANADVGGYDGQNLCQHFLSLCPLPPTSPLNLTTWFAKPKPNPLPPPKTPSGQRLKVLHLSDLHLDPRYKTGTEADCSAFLCCRSNSVNRTNPTTPRDPAPRFGSFFCDSPYALMTAALQAIPILTATQDTGFDFSIFTGDLVSHDDGNQLSQEYILYTETVMYDLMKRLVVSGPIYPILGNHDTYPEAIDAPHNLPGSLANQFSWNYDHVSALWEHEQWLPDAAVQMVKAHYAAYSVQRADGLRILTLNTDFWYQANYFNYINLTSSDNSGMLRFLTDELQDAEDAGDRVWILGHVLSGWDSSQPILNPTNLFYQIVDRFSPHVIANIFFGHTHEDQFSIFYTNNATVMNASTAQTVSWITPSLTPLSNLNAGFRVYEVDSSTFDILDAHTWSSDVSTFPGLDSQIEFGPTFVHEYSTRETYGANVPGWGPNDPLNATWWHLVTELMEANATLVDTFNTLQGKTSVRTKSCTGECATARICYMRSGSASISQQNCVQGFGSVQ